MDMGLQCGSEIASPRDSMTSSVFYNNDTPYSLSRSTSIQSFPVAEPSTERSSFSGDAKWKSDNLIMENCDVQDKYIENIFLSSSSVFNALPECKLFRRHKNSESLQNDMLSEHPLDGKSGSNDFSDFEIHRAVFRNDINSVRQLIDENSQIVNMRDHRGNSPVLLATMRGFVDLAKYLIESGADLDVRGEDENFSLLDEVIALGNEQLLLEVYSRLQRQAWNAWKSKVPIMLSALELMPDFYTEMTWKFGCDNLFASLVENVAPSDTYKIWKQGSSLRIDSTISGYSRGLRVQRGNISIIFQGNESVCPGTVLKIDHGKRKMYNVLRRLEFPTAGELQRACRKLLRDSNHGRYIKAYNLNAKTVSFTPAKTPRFSSWTSMRSVGNTNEETCAVKNGWECRKYEGIGLIKMNTVSRTGSQGGILRDVPEEMYFNSKDPLLNRYNLFGQSKIKKTQKEMVKQLCATMWMSPDFPLSLENVKPILQVLAIEDKFIQQVVSLLEADGVSEAGFPVQLTLPICLGIYASISFSNFVHPQQLRNTFEKSIEEIFSFPKDYGWSRKSHNAELARCESGEAKRDGLEQQKKTSLWNNTGKLARGCLGADLSASTLSLTP